MKFGIICPVAHLEEFAIRSNYHLILPHLFKEFPRYKQFYRERIEQGDFVLQDNSVFELDISLDYHSLIETAEDLHVSEMVAPEVLLDADACSRILDEFLSYRATCGSRIPVLTVAQGTTLQEIVDHFFKLNDIAEVSSLGLPFDLDWKDTQYKYVESRTLRRVLHRWQLVEAIDATAKVLGKVIKPTHIMGLSDPVELQKYPHSYPWIRSNDSSSAFVHGSAGIFITDKGLPCEKIPTKLDFGSKITTRTQIEAVHYNISVIQRFTSTLR